MIIDSGGGNRGTITPKAWVVLERTNMTTSLLGYQRKEEPTVHPVVNSVTKVTLSCGKEVLFLMNNATLIADNGEDESLCTPFEMMRHGVMVDIVPTIYSGKQGIIVEGQMFP